MNNASSRGPLCRVGLVWLAWWVTALAGCGGGGGGGGGGTNHHLRSRSRSQRQPRRLQPAANPFQSPQAFPIPRVPWLGR